MQCFRIKITNPSDIWFAASFHKRQSRTVALCIHTAAGRPGLWWLFTQPHSDRTLPLFIPRQHTEEPSGKLDTHIQQTYRKVPQCRQSAQFTVHRRVYDPSEEKMKIIFIIYTLYTFFFFFYSCTEYNLSYWLVCFKHIFLTSSTNRLVNVSSLPIACWDMLCCTNTHIHRHTQTRVYKWWSVPERMRRKNVVNL